MIRINKTHSAFAVVSLLVGVVFLLTKCISKNENANVIQTAKGKAFAGSASCASCHQNIYDKHINTAHFLTSAPATANNIKGSFLQGNNMFSFSPNVMVAMEKRGDHFYQVAYSNGVEKAAHPFDIVIGSGAMGQSFLYWKGSLLFQLPITYFSAADQWSNSPGFPPKVVFNRIITSRCMECHTTFAKTLSSPDVDPERFSKDKIIYGVDCEKCHGPAAQHVQFHTQNPTKNIAEYIINPAKLSRQQNLDLCALCHGGRLQKTAPSFTFTAGDTLAHYFKVDTSLPDPDNIDVHGNQYGLLRASECFLQSKTLTCNTCHNTHENERGNTVLFSKRCMDCHNKEQHTFCKMENKVGSAISQNCIDCHMPVKSSKAIAVFLPQQSKPTAALIRSHRIAVYPDETKKWLPIIKEFVQKK